MNTTLNRLAIVVRDDGYDSLYTPLCFAQLAAKQGIQVDILFTLWAVRILTREGANAARIHRPDPADESIFREALRRLEVPREIPTLLHAVKNAGNVHLYACQLAAKTFGITAEHLLPEADGILNPLSFLNEIALRADHCQYF